MGIMISVGLGGGARHDVGQGVAHQQAEHRGDHRQLQRAHEDNKVGVHLALRHAVIHHRGGGEEAGDVIKGEAVAVVGKGVVGHKDQRHHDEQHRPHRIGRQRQALHQGVGFLIHPSARFPTGSRPDLRSRPAPRSPPRRFRPSRRRRRSSRRTYRSTRTSS